MECNNNPPAAASATIPATASSFSSATLAARRPSSSSRNLSTSSKCECISRLLHQITCLIRRRLTISKLSGEIASLEQKWAGLFHDYILEHNSCTLEKCIAHSDDMLWYVPLIRIANAAVYMGSETSHLQVFRRQSRNKPAPGDQNVNWQETVCLNLILQQLDYFVTCAVCTKNTPNNLQIHRKNCQRVYPSPSRRRMDAKGECEEITYPKIYFAIDSFDEVFNDMIVGEGECICVELVARDRYRNSEAVIFLGSIRYDILKKLYDSRNSGTWNWAQRWMNSGKQRHEFVKMRGPKGKGFAEMAVTKVASCGFETPMSENGFELGGRGGFMGYDAQFCSQRRMSDTGGLFSRLLYGSTYSAATTPSATVPRASRCSTTPGPGPPPSVTPTLFTGGQRTTSRWYSGDVAADNDGSDLESAADAQSLAGHAVSGGGGMMRGLGSALQLLKDRNQQPDQLQAFLTYITLPWISILEDILSPSSRKPILTFDLQLQKPPPPS